MKQILAHGDVVTMNPDREVLVGGAVVFDESGIIAAGCTSALLAEHPDAVGPRRHRLRRHAWHGQRPPAPHRRPARAQLHPRPAPARAPRSSSGRCRCTAPTRGDDDELSATLGAVESLRNGVTTVIEAGTVAHPERMAAGVVAAGLRGTIGTWGWDIEIGPYRGAVRRGARSPAGGRRTLPGRRAGRGVGHARRPRPRLRRAAGRRRRPRPRARHVDDDAPLPHVVGPRALPRPHRPPPGRAPRPARRARPAPAARPRGVARRIGDRAGAVVAARRSRTARGRICGSARASRGSDATPTSSSAAAASRSGATRRTPATRPTSCAPRAVAAGIARDGRIDPERFGAHDAFELATIAGAEAVGMADRIGSIEPGKQADLVVHRASGWGWTPRGDVGLQLVWGTDGRSVRDVWVAGRQVIATGMSTLVDEQALEKAAAEAQAALLKPEQASKSPTAGPTSTPADPGVMTPQACRADPEPAVSAFGCQTPVGGRGRASLVCSRRRLG